MFRVLSKVSTPLSRAVPKLQVNPLMNRFSTRVLSIRKPLFSQPLRRFTEEVGEGDREIGTVKWFDASKGYGFVYREDGKGELFVHFSAIQGDGYRCLEEGQRVEFTVAHGHKGQIADDVLVLL